jgi:hypothetical protein
MARKFIFFFLAVFISGSIFSQDIETVAPFNIKTITFTQSENNVIPIFRLGDRFQFSFDDLYGNEEDYYYTITHYNYNWTPSDLAKSEYLEGIDNQRIQDYENSFNTLQIYSHYRLNIPNNFTRLTKSGNYLISIFNSNRDLVFSKRFILYEDLAEVPMQIKRARKVIDLASKQNVELTVRSQNILFQNANQNIKVILFQNGKWNNAIFNIKPQYTIGNDLVFKYDKETQFFAGNEYLYFDNKEIRNATNTIAHIDSKSGLYNTHLYTNNARRNSGYTYFPDVNGNFQSRSLSAQNNDVEADYTWVYFTLFSAETPAKKAIYITGMFNNYMLAPENKMDYNADKGVFEKAILIKQGFINFNYTVVNPNNTVADNEAIDGNYYQTENQYTAVVYYRANGERYDRVIGKGDANSINITN